MGVLGPFVVFKEDGIVVRKEAIDAIAPDYNEIRESWDIEIILRNGKSLYLYTGLSDSEKAKEVALLLYSQIFHVPVPEGMHIIEVKKILDKVKGRGGG